MRGDRHELLGAAVGVGVGRCDEAVAHGDLGKQRFGSSGCSGQNCLNTLNFQKYNQEHLQHLYTVSTKTTQKHNQRHLHNQHCKCRAAAPTMFNCIGTASASALRDVGHAVLQVRLHLRRGARVGAAGGEPAPVDLPSSAGVLRNAWPSATERCHRVQESRLARILVTIRHLS